MPCTTVWHVLGVTGALCAEFLNPTIFLGRGVDTIGWTVQSLKHLGGFGKMLFVEGAERCWKHCVKEAGAADGCQQS